MSIPYTYEIIAVHEEGRCMEVVYRADGHPTQHIGARLPYQGETLEAVIDMYAPVQYWLSLQTPVVVPQVGLTGTISPVAPQQPAPTSSPTEPPVIDSTIIEV